MTKEQYKSNFKNALTAFAEKLQQHISTENGEWSVKGFIDVYKNIYTISSDTKIISKILEIHIFPQLIQFAEEIGYNIILAEHQNYYPDFSFVNSHNFNLNCETKSCSFVDWLFISADAAADSSAVALFCWTT